MIIAVDFDGTIVEHRYPGIGKEIPFAIDTLKRLQAKQHQLILWTVREGKLLDEAVEYCKNRGLEFYAANANFPGEVVESKHYSRKLKADMFIDDRNVGGIPNWGLIYRMVTENLTYDDVISLDEGYKPKKKKGFWSRWK